MAQRSVKAVVKTEHQIIVQQGQQVFVKCGRAFSTASKTDHGTFWWKRVTCDDCIDKICTTPEVVNYFNSKEPVW